MISSMVRSLKSRQIGLVTTYHIISGTAGTPADSGFDSAYVQSVTDNGTGDYTITFKAPARQDIHIAGIISHTAGVVWNIEAVDEQTVQITFFDCTDGTTPVDAIFSMTCVHATQLNYNF
jgi:hypothetical protein